MTNRELNAVVMPDSSLQLEWSETKDNVLKESKLFQQEIYKRFTFESDSWLLFLGFSDKKISLCHSLAYFRTFGRLFVHKLTQTPDLETLRHKVKVTITEHELSESLENVPMMTGSEYLNEQLLTQIWLILVNTFSREIKDYKGTVEEFVRSYASDINLVGRIFFNLVENKNSDKPFAFLATYSTRLNQKGESKHLPLKYALQEYRGKNDNLLELLVTVYRAAKNSELMSELLETGELFHPLAWSSKEAFSFLKDVQIYEEAGILCRIPNWWKGKTSSVRLNVNIGDSKPSFLDENAILSFNAQLLLGDTQISEEEAKRLIEESEGLAFIKNKWVQVDPEKLQQTLEAYQNAKHLMDQEGIDINEALRLQLKPEQILNLKTKDISLTVSNGKWLESVIKKLRNPELASAVKPGTGFKAKLRKYQQQGLNWLNFLHTLKFGACLADDMGLGKTIQILGFLSIIKSKKINKACLLVIPASLISNWISEIKKFFPVLKYFVAHPEVQPQKNVEPKTKKELNSLDIVITTYSLAQKYEWLMSYSWLYVILDEAQAIKNPGTKQTKAVKKFKTQNRIIMTGTPIENRLADLWSLFDFINPGLLGNKAEFTRFIKELKNNPQGYSKLRKIISPYMLRRLKTDKSVISDLPDKVEIKTYASLSKKQIVLYQNMVNELSEILTESEEGIQRKGVILGSLTKFKQLCNHTDQYLGTGEYKEKNSGKFIRLREICETIYEKRERVLVFTQFKEITGPLSKYLETIFNKKGLVLHGSVPVGKRKKLIEEFQSDKYVPFMVLSLKAGGVGLNLTKANHVIHFDRWWNPAVENQATDRAFRIGQKKNVIVHKFLTKGTLEEKIDNMLEAKSELSENVIASNSEAWITEMNDDKLMDVFKLTL